MYVGNLEGALLDRWVARAERLLKGDRDIGLPVAALPYSSSMALASPIMEREGIRIGETEDENDYPKPIALIPPHGQMWVGDTEAQAAMLCYVASVFGNTLPDA